MTRPVTGGRRLVLTVTLALLPACSGLTKVDAPDITQPSELESPQGALIRRAGAINEFGVVPIQALASGVLADEFRARNNSLLSALDERRQPPYTPDAMPFGFFVEWYLPLVRARLDAQAAITGLQKYDADSTNFIGELFAIEAYIDVIFAENLCSFIPLAEMKNGGPVVGPVVDRAGLIRRALMDCDSAAAYGAADERIGGLINVGKARALLDSGDFAAAATVASQVAPGFEYTLEYDGQNSANRIDFIVDQRRWASVADTEGVNGLNYRSANDPRVPTQRIGIAFTGDTIYAFVPDIGNAAPFTLASYTEAQLDIAEAQLQPPANPSGPWLQTLNDLRANYSDLAISDNPLTDPGTADGRIDLLFRERAFWLFSRGHRLGDLRRLIRQYGRSVDSVFPTGAYKNTFQTYGTDVSIVPSGEQTNTAYQGCSANVP